MAGAEVYDPYFGRFSTPGSQPTPQQWQPRTALLKDGNVLIISVYEHEVHPGGNFLNTAELYSPKDATFSDVPSDGLGRYASGIVTSLADGKVLVAGGLTDPSVHRRFHVCLDLC